MAKFDLHEHPSASGFLLDVQSDLLSDLNTRIVVPLLPGDQAPMPVLRLNPVLSVDDRQLVMVTQWLAAVPRSILKTPRANLSGKLDVITQAIDFAFQGF